MYLAALNLYIRWGHGAYPQELPLLTSLRSVAFNPGTVYNSPHCVSGTVLGMGDRETIKTKSLLSRRFHSNKKDTAR